jgi:hypothetical protein
MSGLRTDGLLLWSGSSRQRRPGAAWSSLGALERLPGFRLGGEARAGGRPRARQRGAPGAMRCGRRCSRGIRRHRGARCRCVRRSSLGEDVLERSESLRTRQRLCSAGHGAVPIPNYWQTGGDVLWIDCGAGSQPDLARIDKCQYMSTLEHGSRMESGKGSQELGETRDFLRGGGPGSGERYYNRVPT